MIFMNPVFIDSLKKLDSYVRSQDFKGYDPYDALNAEKIKKIKSKWLKLLITQCLVYFPVNLRPLFGIEKECNAKALGLFLSAYCRMYQKGLIEKADFDHITKKLVGLLLETRSKGYSGNCWGFPFNWQDLIRYAPRETPTIVVSSYIGQGFLDLYDVTKDNRYLDIAESITEFILNDLQITKLDTGICFSYTPLDNHVVHNANCLGAAFLTRVYSHTKNISLISHAEDAFDFTISCQNTDGSWAYRLDPKTGKTRNQIDFHQGFIIDCLCDYLIYSGKKNERYLKSLKKAVEFYRNNQFFDDGRAKWRLPRKYPIDIHHLAQGIISFSKMYELTKENDYRQFAYRIAQWTIEHMPDKKGFFYYQKWPLLTNKIEYMRWGQAWMMLALSILIKK
jgi:rhamnogalacturonyl hydrolase YesR